MTNDLNEWMVPDQTAETITVAQLDEAIQRYTEMRAKYKEAQDLVKEMGESVDQVETHLFNLLKAAGRRTYNVEGIGTAYISTRTSCKVPATSEDKVQLFTYIKNKYGEDTLRSMLTINSNKLTAWVKDEIDADPGTVIPGLEAPTVTEILAFRKG
jgi:hypothetical protein